MSRKRLSDAIVHQQFTEKGVEDDILKDREAYGSTKDQNEG